MDESYPVSEQIREFAAKSQLTAQVDPIRYGQVVFEIRQGRVYRVHVTCSHIFNRQDVEQRKRPVFSSAQQPEKTGAK